MRILFAAKHLHYPQGGGGLERNTHELCLRLARRGVAPGVMCDLHPEHSLLALRNRLARKLNPAQRFPMDDAVGYPVYRGWADEDGAQEVVANFRPDLIVAQSAEPVPLLRSFDDMAIPRMAYFHEVLRIRDVSTLASMGGIGLLANSVFTARKMARLAGFAPAVIRPLVDRDFYLMPVRPKYALFVNTRPRKGLETAFRLAESRPDVPFAFVKSWVQTPSETRDMESRAAAAGNITLHPPTNDMRVLYAQARLVLAPSLVEEAWGRVVTEAHINGTPVLASNRGGLPEAVGSGGIMVPHDAPIETWLAAFARLWDDPDAHARYSKAALAYAARPEIQPDAIIDAFLEAVRDFTTQQTGTAA